MNRIRLALLFGLVLINAGCSSNPRMPLRDVSFPDLGAPASATLGQRLLMQGKGYETDLLRITELKGKFVEVYGETFCRRSPDSDRFQSFNGSAVRFLNFVKGTRGYTNVVEVKRGKVCISDIWSGCFDPSKATFSIQQDALCASPNSLQRIIEYNGKTGDVLNFTYREVYGSRVAAPLTQNFTMDLNEGNLINYKGARLRIDQATNQKIHYAVLRNFDVQ